MTRSCSAFRMKSDIDGNSNRGIVAILLLLKGILCAGYFELFDLLHHLRPGLQKDRRLRVVALAFLF